MRLCLVQDFLSLKKLPLPAMLSPLSVLSHSPLAYVVGVEELLLGAVGALLARLQNFNEADFGGSAMNLVTRVGAFGSSSVGSSP